MTATMHCYIYGNFSFLGFKKYCLRSRVCGETLQMWRKKILKVFSVKGRPYSLTHKSDVCLSLIWRSSVGDYNKSEDKK